MPEPVRLALYSPWPVYYHAPLYRRVAADPRIAFTAIFGSDIGVHRRVSNGYSREIDFGVPVLDGYDAVFLRKASRNTSEADASLRDWDIATTLRRGRFDALWMNGYRSITHQLAAATQISLGKPLLVREEQTLLPQRPLWKRVAKCVGLRLLLRRAYGLYIGSENRRWFRHWGVPDDRLFFTPYTVDNDRLRTVARELDPQRELLRRSFGLDPTKPVILSVSRLIEKKQPLMLLEAFRNLRAIREASLLIVGSGPLEHELRRTIASQRIPDVRLAGFLDQNEVTRAYAAADVFVLASTDEPWGLVVNEAMNFGLPIVVTDRVGCGTDLLADGENGFVVPSHDRQLLTNRLLALAAFEQLRRAFGSASLQKIKAWNYDAAAEGVVAAALTSVRDGSAGLDRLRGAE
jgi:glycosyltransferase involved in cell wall biosynthesis